MNINLTLLAQAATFAIFIWFTAKFVWPSLMRAIETRQKQIADGLAAAERGQQELIRAQARFQDTLQQAKNEAAELIAQAQKRAADIIEEAKAQAQIEGERLIETARAEIEQEANRTKEQLRGEVAAIALAGASKILGREVDAKAHNDLLDRMLAEL